MLCSETCSLRISSYEFCVKKEHVHSPNFYYWGHNTNNSVSLCLQWGLFERQFGRSDAEAPDPEGRVPIWGKASVQEMKDKFSAMGFGPRQVCSLI